MEKNMVVVLQWIVSGNAYVSGSTEATDFPTTNDSYQGVSGGGVGCIFQ